MPLVFREAEEEPAEEDGEEEAKKIYKEILEVYTYTCIFLYVRFVQWEYSLDHVCSYECFFLDSYIYRWL